MFHPRVTAGRHGADEATTTFEYDGVGNLTKTVLPNGSFILNEYDAAQRLIAVEDNLGNRIQEDVKDPQGTLATRAHNSQGITNYLGGRAPSVL